MQRMQTKYKIHNFLLKQKRKREKDSERKICFVIIQIGDLSMFFIFKRYSVRHAVAADRVKAESRRKLMAAETTRLNRSQSLVTVVTNQNLVTSFNNDNVHNSTREKNHPWHQVMVSIRNAIAFHKTVAIS